MTEDVRIELADPEGQPDAAALPAPVTDFGPVRLELMGHRYREGRLSETVIAGQPFLRLDLAGGSCEFYAPSSVYCISPGVTPPASAPLAAIPARFGVDVDEDDWTDEDDEEDGGPVLMRTATPPAVYAIINAVNGKVYVGSTVNLRTRMRQHQADLKHGRHSNSYLQNAYNKHGREGFEYHLLEAVADKSYLMEREQHWIDALGASNDLTGYNIITYVAHRAEFPRPRVNISAALKGVPKSAEHRARISAALMGRPGVPLTAEQRARLSEVNQGRRHTPETLERMGAAQKARIFGPLTLEHRAKLSATRAGVPKSAQHRVSISEAAGKLRNEQVLELRARAAAGEKVPLLAAEFGISRGAAYAIVRGRTYKHLILRPDAVYCLTPGAAPVPRGEIPAGLGYALDDDEPDDDDPWNHGDD